MKTLLTFCLLMTSAPALAATMAEDQLRTFASCAGRLSAHMEWQWMFDTSAADQTAAQRATMISLLDATMDPDQGADVLNWRIDAKVAFSNLLTRATFNDDAADARWAQQEADLLLARCRSFLLS